jgi:thiamine pyrophosphate-dependent acetolactate synthase large subunit-like protein
MANESSESGVKRRAFLAGIATAGAAAGASVVRPAAAATPAPPVAKSGPLSPRLLAAELGTLPPDDGVHVHDAGSDYMVDVVKSLGLTYLAAMPGSTFRGIQESFVNYGGNAKPEWITVVHEEISGALAHGYAKAAGRPMGIVVHNDVGVQHASMALFNAYSDRVPIFVLVGNIADAASRRPGAEWNHTANDVAQMVRGYIKYDDQPASLMHFRDSVQRAYSLMMTPPMGAAMIVVDADLAEAPVERPAPPLVPMHAVRPPVADDASLAQIATLLVNAQNPLIATGRHARTPEGMANLVRLAELVQAPVVDLIGRMNFPTNHYLNQSYDPTLVRKADVVLSLENDNLFGLVGDVADHLQRTTTLKIKPGTKVVDINSELLAGSGNYQDRQRFYPSDIAIGADAEASLPALIAAVERAMTPARTAQNAARAQAFKAAYVARREADRAEAAIAWDASPITVPRMCMEIWNQIKHDDFSLVSQTTFLSAWPQRLWDMDKHHNYLGHAGGAGVGYQLGAAVGAALANREHGRLSVNICGDGEFNCMPGALWTAAHHRIPLLTVMHNNRAWHQELMHVTRIADRRDRNPAGGSIGTIIDDPAIDYAQIARGYGMHAEGPITDPRSPAR